MSIIRRMRRQKAIWWERLDPDRFGDHAYASPLGIDCRWDELGQEFRNEQGEKVFSRSVAYPDRILKIGDKLKLGELESDTPENPDETTDVFEVHAFARTPNLRNTESLLTAHLL